VVGEAVAVSADSVPVVLLARVGVSVFRGHVLTGTFSIAVSRISALMVYGRTCLYRVSRIAGLSSRSQTVETLIDRVTNLAQPLVLPEVVNGAADPLTEPPEAALRDSPGHVVSGG